MNRVKRTGLLLCSLLLAATLMVSVMPRQVKAYSGEGDLYDEGDASALNDFGAGTDNAKRDAARDRVGASVTAKFIDIGHIEVTVNLPETLFDSDKGDIANNITWGEAFSSSSVGLYTMDAGDNTEWFSSSKILRPDGESYIYASGVIKSHVGASEMPDLTKASKAEIDAWLAKGLDFYPIVYAYNSGISEASYIYVYAEERRDGDGVYWNNYCVGSGVLDGGCIDAEQNDKKIVTIFNNSDFNELEDYYGLKIPNTNVITANSNALYTYSGGTITRNTDGDKFVYCEPLSYFQKDKCQSDGAVIFSDAWKGKTVAEIDAVFNIPADQTVTANISKKPDLKDPTVINIYGSQSESAENIGDESSGGSDIGLNCTWSWLNPLTWIMCPIIEGASRTVGKLDAEIRERLTVDLSDAGPLGPKSGTYTAWSNIRNISLSLLVIIALIMIISQALSWGPFDAYTVKKVLPRIVAAVIFVSLSWQFTRILISFSNLAGQGVGSLIASAFTKEGSTNATFSALGGSAGIIGIGYFLLTTVDLLVIMSLALTALGAVFVAFLTITFRNILILTLVMTAPLALILWVLPNTQKAWNFWKSSFSGALVAFPIIVAFITTGHVFAKITSDSPDGGLMNDIIIFIAYFGPYFAIPAAFRLAGGAIATVGGMVNDRSKGFFDKQKNFRKERGNELKERAGNNERWNPRGALRGFNNLAGWAASPGANAHILAGTTTGKKILGDIAKKKVEHTGKLEQDMQAANLNDRALHGLSGTDEVEVVDENGNKTGRKIQLRMVKNEEDLQFNIDALKLGGANDRNGANLLDSALIRGMVRASWMDHDRNKGSIAGAAITQAARQGFADGDQIARVAASIASGPNGDAGFAAEVAANAALAGYSQGGRLDLKPGSGVHIGNDANGNVTFRSGLKGGTDEQNTKAQRKLAESLKGSNWMQAKPASIENMADGIEELAKDLNAVKPDGTADTETRFKAKAMRDAILQGASAFANNDPRSKAQWQELINKIDAAEAPTRAAGSQSLREELEALDQRRAGQQGTAPTTPGAGGGGGGGGGGGTP